MTSDLDAISYALKEYRVSADQQTLKCIEGIVAENHELFSKPVLDLTVGKPLHEALFSPRIYYISPKDFSVLKLVAELMLKAHSPERLLKALWSALLRYRASRREFSGLPGLVLRAMALARGCGIGELEQSLRENSETAELLDQSGESLSEALASLANTDPPLLNVTADYVSICDV